MSDPYKILDVSKTASAAEIKSAYRKLAKKLHPDLNPGRKDVEQKFKEVTAAYDLLSDADKRARYDRGEIDAQGQDRGFSGFSGGGRGRTHGQAGTGGDPFAGFGGIDDILAEFMGGGRPRRGGENRANAGMGRARGSDVTYTASIPFVAACLGGKQRLTLTNDKMVDVTIPAGVEEDHKLRLKGQGLPGMGGAAAGDAIVTLHIEPHAQFTRKDRDVFLDLPINLSEAVLGGAVTVPTLDGQVSMKIPKGAGTTLRLKGKGVGGTPQGDLLVKPRILLPDPLPQDLVDLMEEWAKKNDHP